jgi:hypothetical protein
MRNMKTPKIGQYVFFHGDDSFGKIIDVFNVDADNRRRDGYPYSMDVGLNIEVEWEEFLYKSKTLLKTCHGYSEHCFTLIGNEKELLVAKLKME